MRRGAAVVVGAGLVLGSFLASGPAGASSCVPTPVAEQLDRADAVFVGTVTPSGAGDDAVVVAVSDVYKGEVPRTTPVVVPEVGPPPSFEDDRQYVFFVEAAAGALVSRVCGGTRPVADAVLDDLEAATSDRSAYRPAPVAPSPSDAGPSAVEDGGTADGAGGGASATPEDTSEADSPPPVLIGIVVAAVVLVVVGGPFVVRRRARRETVGPTT
ncbi:hypothetical protein KV097_04800 [Mumia sp. zg.B17]|uniref:hypothetical protein n=1 Tax=unclassified Mumia TaxID=2621872 RepID=UPI001C6F59B0|nr:MULTISPECIES: hypothetical protein [unclassified Mumia]MBW9205254.1 hypothetical protein [Mumia sp. zg.B17]MDD9350054.1 hypothetical protein [Mumia sp.]